MTRVFGADGLEVKSNVRTCQFETCRSVAERQSRYPSYPRSQLQTTAADDGMETLPKSAYNPSVLKLVSLRILKGASCGVEIHFSLVTQQGLSPNGNDLWRSLGTVQAEIQLHLRIGLEMGDCCARRLPECV